MRNVIGYCLIVVCGILGLGSGLVFGQGTPTVTVTSLVSTPQPPTSTTGEVWGSTVSGRATLRGAVNPNGLTTTVWFEYGTSSGSYSNISPTQSVTGTITTRVSIDISGISESFEVYYYRIAAQNSAGTSYGDEKEFYAGLNDDNCYIYGYVKDTTTKNSLENAAVTLAFVKGGESSRDALTDASGYYEFVEFLCEDVICTASANGYNPLSQTLPLSFYGEYIYALDFELQPISTTPTPSVTPTPQAPTVVTGEATDIAGSAVLHGTVNAHGFETTAWFEYGTVSSNYSTSTSTETISGLDDTPISISTSSLPIRTGSPYTFYYRIAAENSVGRSYGKEKTFSDTLHGDCLGCYISGKVIDAITGKGIENAIVNDNLTDGDGNYALEVESVDYGCGKLTHTLTASAEGYKHDSNYYL